MSRVRHHVNPLRSDLMEIGVPRLEPPGGTPWEVELGSAEGEFLSERARQEPSMPFVGVEIRREMVAKAERSCREAGLTNVRNVWANMSVDMPRLFAPGSVRRFCVNFPDPWFKVRQQKRRVIGPALIEEMYRALVPGGEVFVETDIFDIALDAMGALEHDMPRRFVNLVGEWRFCRGNPLGARSRRERQCELEGRPIWRLHYRRA